MLFFAEGNSYTVSDESDTVVYCKMCGGVFGDPYDSVSIEKQKIIINNYGGGAWRWTANYTFAYSRIDKEWQLVKIVNSSYHTSDPNKTKTKTKVRLPKDFGKIGLAKFNPDNIK